MLIGGRESGPAAISAHTFGCCRTATCVCAVTGAAIPLHELRYWSVERQETYATPSPALRPSSVPANPWSSWPD